MLSTQITCRIIDINLKYLIRKKTKHYRRHYIHESLGNKSSKNKAHRKEIKGKESKERKAMKGKKGRKGKEMKAEE